MTTRDALSREMDENREETERSCREQIERIQTIMVKPLLEFVDQNTPLQNISIMSPHFRTPSVSAWCQPRFFALPLLTSMSFNYPGSLSRGCRYLLSEDNNSRCEVSEYYDPVRRETTRFRQTGWHNLAPICDCKSSRTISWIVSCMVPNFW